MIRIDAHALECKNESTRLFVAANGCTGCGRCRAPKAVRMTVPGEFRGDVSLSLGLKAQLILIFHTFGVPLLGFCGLALISSTVGLPDWQSALVSFAGLFAGIKLSRKQGFDRISVQEVQLDA